MSLNVVSLFRSAPRSRDWTNQELAEFYRVEASLVRAAIPVEVDRGRSDEGDPWFVFCHANTGDVIIHFALLDGTYVVASPALGSCARGRDFRALIEAQIESHPLVIPKASGNTKLFIHPAALLVVLVTTCFFKLSQTSAAASEFNEPHSSSPGIGSHKVIDAGPDQHAVLLDERAAATVLAAVAVAVAWAQADNSNLWLLSSTRPMEVEHPSQQPFNSAAAASSDSSDALQGASLHPHSLAGAAGAVGTDIATPLSADTSVSLPIQGISSHHQVDQPLTNMELPTPTQNQISSSNYFNYLSETSIVNLSNGNFKGNPIPLTNDTSHSEAPTLAAQEINAIVGTSVQAHVVADASGTPQHLILHAAETSSAPIISISATAVDTTAPSVSPALSAGNVDTTTLNTAETAIQQFLATYPDFKIIDYQKEIIIYDPHLTPTNLTTAVQETFAFHDGSSVILIGLPTPEVVPHLPI